MLGKDLSIIARLRILSRSTTYIHVSVLHYSTHLRPCRYPFGRDDNKNTELIYAVDYFLSDFLVTISTAFAAAAKPKLAVTITEEP